MEVEIPPSSSSITLQPSSYVELQTRRGKIVDLDTFYDQFLIPYDEDQHTLLINALGSDVYAYRAREYLKILAQTLFKDASPECIARAWLKGPDMREDLPHVEQYLCVGWRFLGLRVRDIPDDLFPRIAEIAVERIMDKTCYHMYVQDVIAAFHLECACAEVSRKVLECAWSAWRPSSCVPKRKRLSA